VVPADGAVVPARRRPPGVPQRVGTPVRI